MLFESLTKNATKTGVLFGYYSRSTLFPIRKKEKTESKEHRGKQTVMVGTGIVAAKVGVNLQFQNLKKPVISTFRLQNKPQTGMVINNVIACSSVQLGFYVGIVPGFRLSSLCLVEFFCTKLDHTRL